MEYWSIKGRHVLLAALEAACDSVGEDLAAELQQRDVDRHASLLEEISRLKASVARVDQLERDNHSLMLELDQFRKQVPKDAESSEASPAFLTAPDMCLLAAARPALSERDVNAQIGALSASPPPRSSEDPQNWEKLYAKLALRHEALKQRYEEMHRSARNYREARDDWTKYAESLEVKLEKLELKNEKLERKLRRFEKTDDRPHAPSSPRPQSAHTDTGSRPSDQSTRRSNALPHPEPVPRSVSRVDAVEKLLNCAESTRASSTALKSCAERSAVEETEDEGEGAAELPPIPPDIVAEGVVKIKQEPSSDGPVIVSERTLRKRKHSEDHVETPTPPRRIKSELSISSDPIVTGEAPVFQPHESIDLDEEGRRMPTPRRHRFPEHQHLREENPASPEEALLLMEPRFPRAVSYRSPLNSPYRRDTRRAAPDIPTHKLPRTHRDRRSPIKAAWSLNSGIADVAEETVESFYAPTPHQAGKRPGAQTPAHGRLSSLLNQGSLKSTAVYLPPTRPGRQNDDPRLEKENIGIVLPHEETRKYQASPVKPCPLRKGSLGTLPQLQAQGKDHPQRSTRLRDRPLAELRPEDFKVNPNANKGYRYAFEEVVRNREERSELAGCTDPNCCGRQFRAMAESELSASGPSVLTRIADVKMMQEYLGNEAYRLDDMTRQEREEVWLKAKIQDLANRLGRHRHRFARRPSPPGFWNPDFPSTQEIEQRKEEAEKAERGVVEERWREAMREGGRWLFRDE
ncbi:SAE2-domain-containing protein [Parathielavia appendiculata]|uniref:SAE2-domain-containing protein n=1 Tax=Parathielavia appendiculata TaxID=2587402 RepID=A0AAN6TV44_9PEZI|nr:SAE2-domain-containing protein [Parathielavia appendiculata]